MQSRVAFIIVGWNNIEILPDCLKSAQAQTYGDIDIYYVDNGSKDGSVEMVKKDFPKAKIIEPGYNTGFAKGNNVGINEALKDPDVGYIALLNSDARVEETWTQKIMEFAKLKPRGALYQGTTLDYYDESVIDSTHVYISYNGQATQGNWRYYYKQEIGPLKVFGVNAAACIISRKFIEAQPFNGELFDEKMFMYLEDVDLSARATVMGWDNYLVPKARALHMGSASSGKNPGFSLYMTFRNNSAMLFKNLPLKTILRMLPAIVRGDLDTLKVLRRMGKKDAARKVLKGRMVGILRIPLFIPRRWQVQRHRRIPKGYLWNLMRSGY
jgi:GT2 family glycosyltransferase